MFSEVNGFFALLLSFADKCNLFPRERCLTKNINKLTEKRILYTILFKDLVQNIQMVRFTLFLTRTSTFC